MEEQQQQQQQEQQSEGVVTITSPTIIKSETTEQQQQQQQQQQSETIQQPQQPFTPLTTTQSIQQSSTENTQIITTGNDENEEDDSDDSDDTPTPTNSTNTLATPNPSDLEPALKLPYISVACPTYTDAERRKAAATAAAATKAVMTAVKQHRPIQPPPPFAKVYLWSRKAGSFKRSIKLRPHRTEFYIGTSVSESTLIVNVNGIDLKHGRITYEPPSGRFALTCLSKNVAGFKVLRFSNDGTPAGTFETISCGEATDITYGTVFSVLTKAFLFADPASEDPIKVDPEQISAMIEAGKVGVPAPPSPPPPPAQSQGSHQGHQGHQGQLVQRAPPPPRPLEITMDEPLATLPPPPPLPVSEVMFPGAFAGAGPMSAIGLYPGFQMMGGDGKESESEKDKKENEEEKEKENEEKNKKEEEEENAKKEAKKEEGEMEVEEEKSEEKKEKEKENEKGIEVEKEKEKEKDGNNEEDSSYSPQPPEIDAQNLTDDENNEKDSSEKKTENKTEKDTEQKQKQKQEEKKEEQKEIKVEKEEEEEKEKEKDQNDQNDQNDQTVNGNSDSKEPGDDIEVKAEENTGKGNSDNTKLKRKNPSVKSLVGVVNLKAPEGKKLRYTRGGGKVVEVKDVIEVVKRYKLQRAGMFSMTAGNTAGFKNWTFEGVVDPVTGEVCEDLEPVLVNE